MKKLLKLMILLLLLPFSLIGQYAGSLDAFSDIPQYVKLDEILNECFDNVINVNNNLLKKYLENKTYKTYSFIKNNKLYVISYEYSDNCQNNCFKPNEKKIRSLYLYRYDDSVWNVASNKPIRIDYYQRSYHNNKDIFSYDYYYPLIYYFDEKKGNVRILTDGSVEVKITFIKNADVVNERLFTIYTETYKLKPIDNENYIIVKN